MKPVPDAKKPSSGSNLSDGGVPTQTGCTPKFKLFFSLLPAACRAFILYSSFTAIVDSHGDPSTVFFVVSSLSILGLLYLSMRQFERAVAVKRDRIKTAIWSLAVLIWGIAYVLQPPVMTRILWGIAAVASLLGIVWGIAAVASLLGIVWGIAAVAPTNKEDTRRGCLNMSIWSLAMHLNLLFSYVVTSFLQSPVMTGLIWGIAAVTSLPLAESIQLHIEASSATDIHPQVLSSPFIALVVCLVIASLFFTLALVYMIKKLETNPDFFVRDPINLEVAKCIIIVILSFTFVCLCFTSTGDGSEISSSSGSSLYRDILTVFFLCGCSVSILRVCSLATLEFQRAVITNDLLRSNLLKITIFSLSLLLTSLCTFGPSSVLQVGVMAAGSWTIAFLSWYWELAVTTPPPPPDMGLPAPPPSAEKIQPPPRSDPESGNP